MGDQAKKISFGFSKLAKKTAIVSTHLNKNKLDDDVSKVEFIDCLEGKSIKLKDPVKLDQGPLVIPLTRQKDETNLSQQVNLESISLQKELQNKPTNEGCETVSEDTVKIYKVDEINKNESQFVNETLDELAAKEILEELNRKKTEDDEKRIFNVPLTSNAPSGEKESTLEDYDNIPVTQFGEAMLRGMGWAPGKGIGKNEKLVAPTLPTPRPKGMGLGADKVIKSIDNKSSNEELKMAKGSFVRVLAGPEKHAYGQIQGFDDESGRLIVKLALKNDSISLNEFMVQLVDSNEFKKNSKVINVGKYEKYKEDEVKKESSGNKSLKVVNEKTLNRESISKASISERYDNNKSKFLKKTRSSSSESEVGNRNFGNTNKNLGLPTSQNADHKRSLSRSPCGRRNESPKSQSRSHNFQSIMHEPSSNFKSSRSSDKKHRSHSSNSSDSSSSYSISKRNKTVSSKTKSHVKDRSTSRRRSSSNSTNSDSSEKYSRKKESKHKKKKSRSNKYRSRSRSRSPRRHKHKKSKKV